MILLLCVICHIPAIVSLNSCVFLKVEHVLTSERQLENAAFALSSLTDRLIKGSRLQGSKVNTTYVDIVRDVINLVPVHWLSNEIVCTSFVTILYCSQCHGIDWATSEGDGKFSW